MNSCWELIVSFSLERRQSCLKIVINSVLGGCRGRVGIDLVCIRGHFIVHLHANLAQDLIIHLVCSCLLTRVRNHIELILHHLLLHAHLLRLLRELLHYLIHLLWIHRRIHLAHDTIDPFKVLKHGRVHLRLAQLILHDLHLADHRVHHIDLFARPHQVFRKNLGLIVHIFLRQVLYLLQCLGFLLCKLVPLSFNLANRASDGSFLLFGLLLGVFHLLT